MEQQYFAIKSDGQRNIVCKIAQSMPLPFEVTFGKLSSKRSSAQNSLYWLWLTEVARQIQVEDDSGNFVYLTKDDWHDLCRMKWLGMKVIKIADKSYTRPDKSTAKLKVDEFSEYLLKMESHFLQKGAVLTFPDEYGLAMGVK